LLGALLVASQQRDEGVTPGTIGKGNTWWRRWINFLHKCKLYDDVYLRQFTQHEQHLLLGAFAQKARDNEWSVSSKGYDHLVAGTCRTAIDAVCQAFVTAGFDDPGTDSNGQLAFLLQRQLKGYRNNDPAEQPQKAIPFGILRKLITSPTKCPL
jgi:hypothetical protein